MSQTMVYLGLACLLGLPAPVAATGIFPALRKRRELALAQAQNATDLDMPIPEPMDAGSDGFPVLPPVEEILGTSALTLKTVSTRASDIAGRMSTAQKASESALARQKSAFEQNLKIQEMKNQGTAKDNEKISADIDALKKGNVDLRKQAKEIQKENFVLRSTIHSLQSKMGVAKEFAHKSMDETDDSEQAVLDVLKPHKAKTALTEVSQQDDDDAKDDQDSTDDDDSQSDEEDSDTVDDTEEETEAANSTKTVEAKGASFLEVESKVNRAATKDNAVVHRVEDNTPVDTMDTVTLDLDSLPDIAEAPSMFDRPDAILSQLSTDINALVQQRKQSVSNLKSIFVRDYKAGAARHEALMKQQNGLNAKREELTNLQSKLKEAVAHLESTHKKLGKKLKELGKFLQKLSHVANAPEGEVSRLLDSLPKSVNAKAAI